MKPHMCMNYFIYTSHQKPCFCNTFGFTERVHLQKCLHNANKCEKVSSRKVGNLATAINENKERNRRLFITLYISPSILKRGLTKMVLTRGGTPMMESSTVFYIADLFIDFTGMINIMSVKPQLLMKNVDLAIDRG